MSFLLTLTTPSPHDYHTITWPQSYTHCSSGRSFSRSRGERSKDTQVNLCHCRYSMLAWSTVVPNSQESGSMNWATHSSICLFARTTHSLTHPELVGKQMIRCLKTTWFFPIVHSSALVRFGLLFCTAHFARALRYAHLHACSLTHSPLSLWESGWLDVTKSGCSDSLSHSAEVVYYAYCVLYLKRTSPKVYYTALSSRLSRSLYLTAAFFYSYRPFFLLFLRCVI